MKKYISILLLSISYSALAQVGINATGTAPAPSAMLDVSSTNKGLLPPRMTSTQRTNIASPADGLLVFDSNTQSYWFRQSGAWVELPKGGSTNNYWQLNGLAGNEIKNTNSGGFWSESPTGLNDNSIGTPNPAPPPIEGAGTRLMWIPSRSAFRVGTLDSQYPQAGNSSNIGYFSFASGYNAMASGNYSTSMGRNSVAGGIYSTAFGINTWAFGDYSTAMGVETRAYGNNSFAMGNHTTANGFNSIAVGNNTNATGITSMAMGGETNASASYSTSFGFKTAASGFSSTAMGTLTTASGNFSTAIGYYNSSNLNGLFMVGNGTPGGLSKTVFIITQDNNRVGIGIEEPLAPLHVAGQSTITGSTSGRLFNFGTNNLFSYTGSEYPSIIAEAAIISKTTIGAFQNIAASDNRIKNIISISNNAEDLARLRKIEITNYRMKDEATWGNQTFKKVIAQQVELVYPEVIKKQTSTIPDIYTLADSVVYDVLNKKLSISLSKDYRIKIGDKIELVHQERGKIQAEVESISGNSFTVKDWQYATDKIFVFGREVNDFRSVDYEALSMLGISAIQQLAKENDILKSTNQDINFRLRKLELLEKRLSILESNSNFSKDDKKSIDSDK